MINDTRASLSTTERVARVLLSLTLITATITGEGFLGALAIVPLLAIYPGITGLLGFDPLTAGLRRTLHRRAGKSVISPVTRTI